MEREIVWAKTALRQFESIYNHILEHRPEDAEKVRTGILNQITKAGRYPEMFGADNYIQGNNGTNRYFELHKIRVSYKIVPDKLLITGLRHTGR